MMRKAALMTFIFGMMAGSREHFMGNSIGDHERITDIRPCINCGGNHTHNNAFCSPHCCKIWRADNPNQGRIWSQ